MKTLMKALGLATLIAVSSYMTTPSRGDRVFTVVVIYGLAVFLWGALIVASKILNTDSVHRATIKVDVGYVQEVDRTGARRKESYFKALDRIREYMTERGIREMEVNGQVFNLALAEEKEKPAEDRVRKILLEMEYQPETVERLIHKGQVELGGKVRFDELMKFCLEQ
jgi:hypothetical protein